MKRLIRPLLLSLLLLPVLTITAFADSGPKDQLIVRVTHAPQEAYYLDLVTQTRDAGTLHPTLSEQELAALDKDLLHALVAAVPEGSHACTAQGSTGAPMWGDLQGEQQDANGNPLHQFGYVGLPDTYQILIVTKSGETFLSQPYTRKVLQSSATVDWADKTVSIPPVWVGYVLQFLSTLLPTLLVEGALLLLFGFSWKRNWKPFLFLNLITQGGLALWLAINAMQHGANQWFYYFAFVPAEILIAFAEAGLYRRCLTGRSKARAFCYGLTANAASVLLGLWTVVPIWRFIVSLS